MEAAKPVVADRKRWVLAIVLAVIAAVLLIGGGYLLTLGGSIYYLLAGLAVGVSAYFAARGDRRAIWVYLAMLAGTLLWALWESESGWGVQARLFAPAVLGLWVVTPWLRRLGARWLVAIAAVIVIGAGIWLFTADRNQSVAVAQPLPPNGSGEWLHYGNDLGGSRFSPLTQINASNVGKLEKAWSFGTGVTKGIGFEVTPIMVRDSLYLCTPNNIVIALDPETGAERWRVDPKVDMPGNAACRGVSYFKVPDAAAGPCAERIIFATTDARLMAVDAATGATCTGFGAGGTVDLKRGMGEVARGYYYVSSAPTIVNGKVVVGGWVMDGQYVGEPSGVVRGFDAVTGQFAWAWDMDRPGVNTEPPEGQTYSRGTANSWGPMSGDEKLGLVYLPTGNATPDYWGAHRSPGSEKYSVSVVALDAGTGAVRWSFQTVHHDVWDYDVPSQATLIDLPIGGQLVPALIQATKQGQVYLLDRRNGRPLAKVVERATPQGPAPGDYLSPTQPFSVGMPAFDNTLLTEANMWGATPIDQLWCRIKFREARYEGPMTPPGLRPSITYPSYIGGVNWAGVSIDPERGLMIANWSRIANYTRMVPRADPEAQGVGPSTDGGVHVGQPVPQIGTPFALFTAPFVSPLGIPCTPPPFGKIAAVDLATRKIRWEQPLGTSRDIGPLGIKSHLPLPMGVPNTGGSLVTRAGLAFIGATQERTFRAFDVNTGKKLWSVRLPGGGNATPMSYISPRSGRQFVVIAAGGNASLQSGRSDQVVAFALPKEK